jgi:hypothetical protein
MVLLRAAGLVFAEDHGSGAKAYRLRRQALSDLADRLGGYLE